MIADDGDGGLGVGGWIGISVGILVLCGCLQACARSESAAPIRTVAPNATATQTSDVENPPMASIVRAVGHKDSASTIVGIALKKVGDHVIIDSINEDSILAGKGLDQGMKVLAINGVSCPQDLKESITLLKQAEGDLTIVALSLPKQTA